jgi:threonine dehydrogenase-like Zn-dependent dehydrogenase
MLDSNGCNTTAASGVALLSKAAKLQGKTAVVLAGTGPVGQRAAVLLAISGANVRLTSRKQSRSVEACDEMQERFGVEMTPMQASDDESINIAMDGAHVVFGAAKAGIQLLNAKQWQDHPTLELIADVGTSKILGFEGIDVMDKDTERHGKRVFGGIGIGALKLKLHRACIAKLFESNDLALDAEAIYKIAQQMA